MNDREIIAVALSRIIMNFPDIDADVIISDLDAAGFTIISKEGGR